MSSFTSLPGELTALVRQFIPCDELDTHLALHTVARGARLILYDENVWRELCYDNGSGGMFREVVPERWRKSILILARYQRQAGVSYYRQHGPLQWAKAFRLERTPFPVPSPPSIDLNPAFTSLSFDRRALSAGRGLAAAYLHAQPWDLDNHRGRTIADQIAEFIPTQLDHHIGAYALATMPAVAKLDIVFDHWGSTIDAATAEEAYSFSSELAQVRREEGIRVLDVVEGMVKWLMTPLTDAQVNKLVESDQLLDPELYAMLEFSTDPDTLAAYWRRKYRRRGDIFRANFAGLRTVEGSPDTVRAVWCPEIRFEVLGYNGVVNAKEIGDTPAAGSWLVAQINQISALV